MKAEQICKGFVKHGSKHLKFLKRQYNKLQRRLGKQKLDDAPKKKEYYGYSD